MYETKNLNFGVCVIDLYKDEYKLKNTEKSVNGTYPDAEVIHIVNQQPSALPLFKFFVNEGGILSKLNLGIKNSVSDWVYFLIGGSIIPKGIINKLSRHVSNTTDILFPVKNRSTNILNTDFNGFFINRNHFIDIGEFEDKYNFDQAKLLWSGSAIVKNSKFKGIVGAQVF